MSENASELAEIKSMLEAMQNSLARLEGVHLALKNERDFIILGGAAEGQTDGISSERLAELRIAEQSLLAIYNRKSYKIFKKIKTMLRRILGKADG